MADISASVVLVAILAHLGLPLVAPPKVYTLDASRRWSEPVIHQGEDVVRAAPFDAIGLGLSALWT